MYFKHQKYPSFLLSELIYLLHFASGYPVTCWITNTFVKIAKIAQSFQNLLNCQDCKKFERNIAPISKISQIAKNFKSSTNCRKFLFLKIARIAKIKQIFKTNFHTFTLNLKKFQSSFFYKNDFFKNDFLF